MKDLDTLSKKIKKCHACPLWKRRTQAVSGEGPADALIVFLGEAPGKEEDKTSRPFVGKAGKFLNNELERFSLDRKRIFITNCVKCRTPKNRRPTPKELQTCKRLWLDKQLAIIHPRLICLLGDVAVKNMLGAGFSVMRDNGKIIVLGKRRFFIMPHPSAAMRFTKMRLTFEKDLRILKKLIDKKLVDRS